MSNDAEFEKVERYIGWQRRTISHLCKEIELWFRFPDNFNITAPEHNVLIYLPGDGRVAQEYADSSMKRQADLAQVILVGVRAESMPTELSRSSCPEKADRSKFWRKPYGYQWNNAALFDNGHIGEPEEWSNPFDPGNYLSAHIENAFQVLVNELQLNTERFYYWGHSAGGQLLTRHVIFGDLETSHVIKAACAANPTSYTFPTMNQSYGTGFPLILDSRVFTPEKLRKIYADLAIKGTRMNFTLTLGTYDLAESTGREAIQGLTRFERGNNFFDYIESMRFVDDLPDFAENISFSSWEDSFIWKKIHVSQVNHEAERMWQTCWNEFFGTNLTTPERASSGLIIALNASDMIIPGVVFFIIFSILEFVFFFRRGYKRKNKPKMKAKNLPPTPYVEGPGRMLLESLRGKKQIFPTLLECIPVNKKPAILDSNTSGKIFSYESVTQTIANFRRNCLDLGTDVRPGVKVMTLVPNGPELSTLLLCLFHWCIAVPVNIQENENAIMDHVTGLGIQILIIDKETMPSLKVRAEEMGVDVLLINKTSGNDTSSVFKLEKSKVITRNIDTNEFVHPNQADNLGMILQTSGTSGVRKSVPYTLQTLVLGAHCIIDGWKLTQKDMCYNCMPLFHIGGISRNLLAVIFSGGSVIASPGFDAGLFWQNLKAHNVTWYYSGPVHHQAFLEEGRSRGVKGSNFKLRFIANAAGNLTKELNLAMHQFYGFKCAILPGYGMTECMPICSPPMNYSFGDRPTTSGRSTGPNIGILSESSNTFVRHEVGQICVSGLPVFNGYLDAAHNEGAFFVMDGTRWFKTGDLGYLDDQDYLFVTGRKKEVINRGGEILSPVEIEIVFKKHPKISECMVFAAKHETLQECAGILVKLHDPNDYLLLSELHEFAKRSLSKGKLPQILVLTLSNMPRTTTGKLTRVKFADKLNLPIIQRDMNFMSRNKWERVYTTYKATTDKGVSSWTEVQTFLPPTIEAGKSLVEDAKNQPCSIPEEVHAERTEAYAYLAYVSKGCSKKVVDIVSFVGDGVSSLSDDNQSKIPVTPSINGLHLPNTIQDIELVLFVYPDKCGSQWKSYLDSITSSNLRLLPDTVVLLQDYTPNISEEHLSIDLLIEYERFKSESDDQEESNVELGVVDSKLRRIWQNLLDLEKISEIKPNSSFFDLGGNSFLIGRLSSQINKVFNVEFGIMQVYEVQKLSDMAAYIDLHMERKQDIYATQSLRSEGSYDQHYSFLMESMRKLSRFIYLCIYSMLQLLATNLFYPIRRTGLFMLFLFFFSFFYGKGESRLQPLLRSLVVTKVISVFVFPFIGIILKWLIIFRFREGEYKTYGSYYLRWYLTKQFLLICGKGFFGWFNWTRILYYNLLGARISFFASVHRDAVIEEYDLLSIGAKCEVSEEAVVRCFAVETKGRFSLRPITMEYDSAICPKGIIAPGDTLPSFEVIRPTMSSHEIGKTETSLSAESAREHCNVDDECYPGLCIYTVFIMPIYASLILISYLPIIFMFIHMVFDSKNELEFLYQFSDSVTYFSQPGRISYFILAKVMQSTVVPVIYFSLVVFIKRVLIGKFKPGGRGVEGSLLINTKHYLMATLLPDETLGGMLGLLGKHYSAISVCFRLLGAKIGDRVYWPGSGFRIVEYDLLEIGDDVIFGSRSLIRVTSKFEAKRVIIKTRANVADRCAILPGAVINNKTVVGTGTLIVPDMLTKPNSIYLGGQILTGASELETGDNKAEKEEVSTPFGRAFYLHQFKKKYTILNQYHYILLSVIVTICATIVQSAPLAGSLLLGSYLNGGYENHLRNFIAGEPTSSHYWIAQLFLLNIALFNVVMFSILLLDIVATRLVVGRRKVGSYSWDESSYCQRWQINLILQDFRRRLGFAGYGALDFIRGTLILNQYYRFMGSKVGAGCCLFPNGGRPMLTEPDLVEFKDNVTVDCAALVCHLNSRGQFTLNKLVIGEDCALRTNSRMLAGAIMQRNSQLLEHTLLFQGDTTNPNMIYQGWPAGLVGES